MDDSDGGYQAWIWEGDSVLAAWLREQGGLLYR